VVQQKPKVKTTRTPTKFDEEKKPISILPKTNKQAEYIKAIIGPAAQVVCFGPSGTGKTYVVSSLAASLYHTKKINKIVITRPHVAVGDEKLGFLKGDLREKTEPWALPVLDVLEEHLGKAVVESGLKNGNIEAAPLGMMRGRSFRETFIIVDECFTGDTEIMTSKGFKRLDEVSKEDFVGQFTGLGISFVNPSRIVEKDYSGNLCTTSTHRFSMTATENHRAIYLDGKGLLVEAPFSVKPKTNWKVPVAGVKCISFCVNIPSEVILACALQADGSYEGTTKSNEGVHNYWTITVKREEKIERLEAALVDLGLAYSKYDKDSKGRVRFYLKGQPDIKYVTHTKSKDFVLQDILFDDLHADFLKECLFWDGSTKGGRKLYCSTNKHNIDTIQTLAHLCGYSANYGVTYDKRKIFKVEPKPYYRLNISDYNNVTLQGAVTTSSQYSGKVYCVTVPTGMIVVRQKGRVFITGNCQNITFEQLKMLLTRVGEGSKIILNGDIMQSDLKSTDGLTRVLGYVSKYNLPVPIVEFGVDDIVRSELTKMWVEVFLKEKV
jgi:phosphate starvation-inducible protein PhoH